VPEGKLQWASDASGEPAGGVNAFARNGAAGTTLVDTENGKLIFPPGGSFLVYVSLVGDPAVTVSGKIRNTLF
jgi:hypothetical protein